MTTTHRRRWPWILLALLVALPVAAFLAARAFLDADTLRPRLVAAVESATGRRFTVGDIGLALSLRPTVELRDIALANAEGGSRPQMLTARRVEVQAALLPLLSRRLEISRIVLDAPDLLLETDAGGRPNWQFRPTSTDQAPPQDPAPSGAPSQPLTLAVDALRIENGRLTWRDARTATAETVEIPRLDAAAPLAGPTTARGTLVARGQQLAVEATTGAVAALNRPEPWPFDLRASVTGAEARARGTYGPAAAWTAELNAAAPDLARLAPLLPDMPLPPLRDVALAGKAAGTGAEVTSAEALALRVGASDLSALRPNLRLTRLEVTAPRLDAPLTLTADAALAGTPLTARGTAGTPAILLGRAPGPLPLDLRFAAGGADAAIGGTVADPRAIAGVDLALNATIPDLAALSPLAGTALPPVRDIRAGARLAERTPGFQGGAHLRNLIVTSPPAEARGDLTVVVGERPGLTGRLDIARLDLDALRPAQPAAPAQPAPAQPAPAAAPTDGRVIPATPLPLGALRSFDAELDLTVATLTTAGATWQEISAPIRLEAGQGRVSPLTVTTPGGPLRLDLAANAAAQPPALQIAANSPGLDLAALQRALGQPVRLTGRAELDADFRGTGADLRAVAATLAGHLGIAALDAIAEPPLVAPIVGALRERVPFLPQLPQRLPIECVALRAEGEDGVMRVGTLLVDAPAAKVAGTGTVNLRDETLALRLLHDVRAAGAAVRVAADVGGTLANPGYRGDARAIAGEVIGNLAGRFGGDAGAILGGLAGAGNRPAPLPECGPALTAARGGRAGAVPAPRPDVPAQAAPALPGPAGDVLRGLLGR